MIAIIAAQLHIAPLYVKHIHAAFIDRVFDILVARTLHSDFVSTQIEPAHSVWTAEEPFFFTLAHFLPTSLAYLRSDLLSFLLPPSSW